MFDYKTAANNFLNALNCISKLMEQYKSQNAAIEKAPPMLREIVGGTWKKKEELKGLKSEVIALDRKIQLELTPSNSINTKDSVTLGIETKNNLDNKESHSSQSNTSLPNKSMTLLKIKNIKLLKRYNQVHSKKFFIRY